MTAMDYAEDNNLLKTTNADSMLMSSCVSRSVAADKAIYSSQRIKLCLSVKKKKCVRSMSALFDERTANELKQLSNNVNVKCPNAPRCCNSNAIPGHHFSRYQGPIIAVGKEQVAVTSCVVDANYNVHDVSSSVNVVQEPDQSFLQTHSEATCTVDPESDYAHGDHEDDQSLKSPREIVLTEDPDFQTFPVSSFQSVTSTIHFQFVLWLIQSYCLDLMQAFVQVSFAQILFVNRKRFSKNFPSNSKNYSRAQDALNLQSKSVMMKII